MTAPAVALVPALDKGCSSYVQGVVDAAVAATPHHCLADLIPKNPFNVAKWGKLLALNDPGPSPRRRRSRC